MGRPFIAEGMSVSTLTDDRGEFLYEVRPRTVVFREVGSYVRMVRNVIHDSVDP